MSQVLNEIFDSDAFPAGEALLEMQGITKPLYDVHPINDPQAFRAHSQGFRVGELIFTQARFSPLHFKRGAAHVRGKHADFLVLQQQLEGEEQLVMRQGRLRLRPGYVYLRDWAQAFDSRASAMCLRSVVIPRHLLSVSRAMSDLNPVLSQPLAEPPARMIAAAWDHLLDELPHTTQAHASTLCGAFLAALNALWGFAVDADGKPTLGAVQQYVSARLMGKVEVADICAHFQISRASVYRLFQPLGGVRRYVSRLRLERCYAELWEADPATTQVGDVGSSWGFGEASTFTRSFSRHFGKTPSQVLGQGLRDAPEKQAGIHDAASSPSYLRWFEEASGVAR